MRIPPCMNPRMPKRMPEKVEMPNYALYFDGDDDHITIPDDPSLRPGTDDITIEAFIRTFDIVEARVAWSNIIYQKGGLGVGHDIYFDYTGVLSGAPVGRLAYWVLGSWAIITAVDYDDERWHQVVGSADRDGLGVEYVDAGNVAQADISGEAAVNHQPPDPAYIGGIGPADRNLKCIIACLRVLIGKALSRDEVRESLYRGIVREEPNCVLCLRMEEGQGATVYDSSGQGNDGAITGATWRELKAYELLAEVGL